MYVRIDVQCFADVCYKYFEKAFATYPIVFL